MSRDLDVQLGLCCLNTELRAKKTPVFASRSIILKTFKDKGFEYLKSHYKFICSWRGLSRYTP